MVNSNWCETMAMLVFAGKDASRGLAKSSVKLEDAVPEWHDLDNKEKGVLNDWVIFPQPIFFFSDRLS